jgi:hypothetical protein
MTNDLYLCVPNYNFHMKGHFGNHQWSIVWDNNRRENKKEKYVKLMFEIIKVP